MSESIRRHKSKLKYTKKQRSTTVIVLKYCGDSFMV